jgi:uncharacterized membrane protein YozB (DUF420 family)/cytochrome oxidase Cu insertion factor (SCO1/SenC/PrrC family)
MSRYLGLSLIFLVAAPLCAQEPEKLYRPFAESIPAGDFRLQDRSGKYVRTRDMQGKVWVAHFFRPGCNLCSRNNPTVQRLAEKYRGKNDVYFVSFALEFGDLPTLKAWAADHKADPEQWLILGGTEEQIRDVVAFCFFQQSFRNKTPTVGDEINHSTDLLLIDAGLNIVGRVNGVEEKADEALSAEIEKLRTRRRLEERIPVSGADLPWFNAMLNATCTMLLILGWVLIKFRYETLHKIAMLLALAVSMVFLSSYLFYHFVVMEMEPMRFQGEGAVRYVYYAVLLSHTLLAMVAAPLAIYVTVQGLRDARKMHVALARWTLPIWLYVSVTGVVVYWMLYR